MAENIASVQRDKSVTTEARKTFNKRARDVTELEAKFLVQSHAMDADLSLFTQIEDYFRKKGWIGPEQKDINLISRQLDLSDKSLLDEGHTIRVRGNCVDNDLAAIKRTDVCVKTGKQNSDAGMNRGEYEDRIDDFWKPDLQALRDKYPIKDYPEIHDILDGVEPDDLVEFFRIDCNRQRFVVEFPDTVTKLKGKRFVGELMLDEIRYVLDHPALPVPIPFHYEMEVECEVLFKACAYDTNAESAKMHSDLSLTKAETQQGMESVIRHIKTAANGRSQQERIKPTSDSKAERGFSALDRLETGMLKYVQKQAPEHLDAVEKNLRKTGFLGTIFSNSTLGIPANDNMAESLRNIVTKKFAESIQKRPIAVLHKVVG